MKKFIILLVLIQASCFADWSIRQYTGPAIYKEWIVEDKDLPYGLIGRASMTEMIIKFKVKNTGRLVVISPPFRIEEL